MAGHNPAFIMVVVPFAELGSLLLAISAVIVGYRTRLQGAPGWSGSVGIWIGILVIVLVIGGGLVGTLLVG